MILTIYVVNERNIMGEYLIPFANIPNTTIDNTNDMAIPLIKFCTFRVLTGTKTGIQSCN